MPVLYRKYRPQKFSEVVGQEYIKRIISEEIKEGKVAHAFLFVGPRGVGKTTLARILAKSLNCLNRKKGEAEPCGKCDNCRAIDQGSLLDVVEIDAASHTGVQNVRDNIISVSQVPPLSDYKVFIIDEAHMLSTSAFNALLKTLEEPPEKVVFVLATTEAHKLPVTIISRCQRFDFSKISPQEIEKKLANLAQKENIEVGKEVLQEIAYQADGCLRDAESLLGQVFSLGKKKITLEDLDLILPTNAVNVALDLSELLVERKTKEAIALVNKAFREGYDFQIVFNELLELWRKVFLIKTDPSLGGFAKQFDSEKGKKIIALSQQISLSEASVVLDILKKRLLELKDIKIEQLPLELAVFEISELLKKEKTDSKKNKTEEGIPQKKESEEVSLADVQFVWPQIIEGAKKFNNSLSSLLSVGKIISFQDRILQVGFPYDFHVKKASERKNKDVVEGLLKENLKVDIKFLPVLNKEEDLGAKEGDFSLDTFSEIFGDDIEVN